MCESKQSARVSSKSQEDVYLPQQIQHQFEVNEQVVEGSFIRFFVDGKPAIEIKDLRYNRYYPAISGYNYCKIRVNFGLPSVRIPGYPQDFYVLSECLAEPNKMYSQHPLTTTFGKGQFNIEKILQYEAEDRKKQEEEEQRLKQSRGKASPAQSSNTLPAELATIKSESDFSSKPGNTSPISEDQELQMLFSGLTNKDV